MTKYEARLRDYGMLDSELISVLADIDDEMARCKEDAELWRQSENDCNKANRELEAEMVRLRKALNIAVKALEESRVDIDNYIDAEYPANSHVVFEKKNRICKELNPARVALAAIREIISDTERWFPELVEQVIRGATKRTQLLTNVDKPGQGFPGPEHSTEGWG